jgi:aromatic ring-opening dioxygenase LigB subunit
MMKLTIVFAGLSPHPPVIIPEIGGERLTDVAKTVEGLRRVMQRLIASAPQIVIVISPHAPRDRRGFTAYTGPRLRGSFATFGFPDVDIDIPNDVMLLSRVSTLCEAADIPLWMIPAGRQLDHGALVPLYYLREAGWTSSIIVLGLPYDVTADHLRFGSCLAEAAGQMNMRAAIIASGDMSHRLTPDAPYEYHTDAHLYDEQLIAAIAAGSVEDVFNIRSSLRELAGEDTYQSLLVALGALGRRFHQPQVYSYEHPFGVGYLTAVLADYSEPEGLN